MSHYSKLALGGHSFIAELGNDTKASFEEQCAIVNACLDSGIKLIDTTYYQERIALGKILQQLGRRKEAEIIAWNFFKQPGKENELVGYTPYESEHLDMMLEELQTNHIDLLVIHAHTITKKFHQELELANKWVIQGKVKKVGIGMAQTENLQQLPIDHPITHVLAPYNAFNKAASELFEKAAGLGLGIIALSPFIRGWKLDEINEDNNIVADILLRWVTSQPLVDHVIVSMRKREWVALNLQSERRGALTELEQVKLTEWVSRHNK